MVFNCFPNGFALLFGLANTFWHHLANTICFAFFWQVLDFCVLSWCHSAICLLIANMRYRYATWHATLILQDLAKIWFYRRMALICFDDVQCWRDSLHMFAQDFWQSSSGFLQIREEPSPPPAFFFFRRFFGDLPGKPKLQGNDPSWRWRMSQLLHYFLVKWWYVDTSNNLRVLSFQTNPYVDFWNWHERRYGQVYIPLKAFLFVKHCQT